MRRKILLTGLTLALFVAGFAVATWPAVAELRTITVTLVGGQEIVTTVDVPPGTPANQIKLPEITAPIAGIHDGTRGRRDIPRSDLLEGSGKPVEDAIELHAHLKGECPTRVVVRRSGSRARIRKIIGMVLRLEHVEHVGAKRLRTFHNVRASRIRLARDFKRRLGALQ